MVTGDFQGDGSYFRVRLPILRPERIGGVEIKKISKERRAGETIEYQIRDPGCPPIYY